MSKITDLILPNGTWICPAGVSEIIITPTNSSGTPVGVPRTVQVVPNTTYNIVVNSTSYVINNANTFGSLYNWTGSGYIKLSWVE